MCDVAQGSSIIACLHRYSGDDEPVISMKSSLVRLALLFLVLVTYSMFAKDGPLSPEESIAQFQISKKLRVELVAAEPDVVDPVAIAFDEHARMYVAENHGYPLDKNPAVGVVALLEDKDKDGRFEHRTDFATGLTFPNGLLPWKGGVIVTCAPDILYLKDTDGDGVADVKRVLLTGFSVASTTQLRVSHPTLGLDGWVYLTAGLQGGEVYAPEKPELGKVKFSKNDSRFHPETLEFQAISGRSQFGQSFDDFGNRFSCANRNPIWHHVFQPWHLKRNPNFSFTETFQIVGDAQGDAKVFPLSSDTTTAGYHPRLMGTPHAGSFTSACATYLFRGRWGRGRDNQSVFVCEPAQNLVQRQELISRGSTFDSKRVSEEKDFLVTEDSWSRMVYATQGPDGCLYLVDFYRKTLDHPQYLPEEMRATADFQSGRDRGRIYRVTNHSYFDDGSHPLPTPPMKTGELFKEKKFGEFMGESGWLRDTEFRLRMENLKELPLVEMRSVLTNRYGWGHRNPTIFWDSQARGATRALWLLHQSGELTINDLNMSTNASSAVDGQIARIIEQRIGNQPELLSLLGDLSSTRSPESRFHVAMALGATDQPERLEHLVQLAFVKGNDKWMDAAILLGVQDDEFGFSERFMNRLVKGPSSKVRALWGGGYSFEKGTYDNGAFLGSLGQVIGKGHSDDELVEALPKYLGSLSTEKADQRRDFLSGVLKGLESRRRPFQKLIADKGEEGTALLELVQKDFSESLSILMDSEQSEMVRIQALELYTKLAVANEYSGLIPLLAEKGQLNLRLAVVDALVATGNSDVVAPLLDDLWRGFGLEMARRVVDRMLARGSTTPMLLSAIKEGVVQQWMVDANRRGRLMKSKDKKISALAKEVFGELESGDRMAAYEKAKAVLKLDRDVAKGRKVFTRSCATCHKYGNEGASVGPDLTGVRNQPAEALLLHIIVPGYEVYPGFAGYEVETNDDRVLSGLLMAESDNSIRLKMAQGIEETILRSDILELRSGSLSLMPDALEQTMTPEELAGLIGFLKQ
ncbi:c-type cytochrome [Verrucomicrobia bacterium]|nr:c-type cytochrome [Verrucomicrobiota bacterium]